MFGLTGHDKNVRSTVSALPFKRATEEKRKRAKPAFLCFHPTAGIVVLLTKYFPGEMLSREKHGFAQLIHIPVSAKISRQL